MRSFLCMLVLVSSSFSAYAETKVAVLDVDRAISESNDGKAALGKLKGEMDKLQKDLDARKTELKKSDEELAKQEAILKPDAVAKKRQELGQKVQALQDFAMRSQKDLNEKERKAMIPIADKVSKAVATIAGRDKLSLVVRREAVVWPNQSDLDITNEVIKKVNETK
jgi:outer membrane protein